jgi:uncharacterized damage-inducible protein DinB
MRFMKRGFAAVVVALVVCAGAARAEDAAPVTGVRGDMIKSIDDARSELVELAEAMPAAKYAWRPGKGVRSVGEVYMHVVEANYLIPTLMNVAPPQGVDMKAFDAIAGDKTKVVAALKASFDHATNAVRNSPDADLEKPVKIFGKDGTVRELEFIIVTHAHEHLGQSIAYARMNNVTPPWTAREMAAQAASDKAKTK